MTYALLDAAFLAVVAVVAVVTVAIRRPPRWGVVALGAGVLVVVSIVFDNVMIGVGLVGYDRAQISGLFLGIAPLEDFAYAIAAAVLLPCVWMLTKGRRDA